MPEETPLYVPIVADYALGIGTQIQGIWNLDINNLDILAEDSLPLQAEDSENLFIE